MVHRVNHYVCTTNDPHVVFLTKRAPIQGAQSSISASSDQGNWNVTVELPDCKALKICFLRPVVVTCCALPSPRPMFPALACVFWSKAASIPATVVMVAAHVLEPVTLRSPERIVCGLVSS